VKLLLDENLPHILRHELPGHQVFTVSFMEWTSFQNGTLLRFAGENGFDALITVDRSIRYQRNLAMLPCGLIVLHAETNKIEDLKPLMPLVLEALNNFTPCSIIGISA